MGLVNRVVPLEDLESATLEWCDLMQQRSPLALRMIKRSLMRIRWQHGLMQLAGGRNAIVLFNGRSTRR